MNRITIITVLFASIITLVSCGNDDENPMETLSIMGIPPETQVALDGNIEITGVVLRALQGIRSFQVSLDGINRDLSDLISMGDTEVTINTRIDITSLSLGIKMLEFTLTDVLGVSTSVLQRVTIAAYGIVNVTENITVDTRWQRDNEYQLDGRIIVKAGVTLTIQPGTVIKGEAGSGVNATVLLVESGGTLIADGDATSPIIFTSIADGITPTNVRMGHFASPNLNETINGLWGGLILLGDAPISAGEFMIESSNGSRAIIEGFPGTFESGIYGGSNPNHNAGKLDYVSIRHGGSNIGSGNEINGLTLGGVGAGTQISNIEIVANQDDGIEFFGGNVSVDSILIWNVNDDGLDTDQDWIGTASNFIIVNCKGSSFELDGPEASADRDPNFRIENGTVYVGRDVVVIDFDDNTDVNFSNVYFFGFEGMDNYVAQGIAGGRGMKATINRLEYTFPSGFVQTVSQVFAGVDSNQIVAVAGLGSNTVGPASKAGFEWTYASQSGTLDDIGF